MDSLLISLVGQRGSGKNVHAVRSALLWYRFYPHVQVKTNFPIALPNCTFVDDILIDLAKKEYYEDTTPAFYLIDEAALAGLESRGSGSASKAIDADVIDHSRKVNIHAEIISQMTSMVDRRVQTLYDFNILCEAEHDTQQALIEERPDRFRYTVFDEYVSDKPIREDVLDARVAEKYIWPLYDSKYIPNKGNFNAALEARYGIGEEETAEAKILSVEELFGPLWDFVETVHEEGKYKIIPRPELNTKIISLTNALSRHHGFHWIPNEIKGRGKPKGHWEKLEDN